MFSILQALGKIRPETPQVLKAGADYSSMTNSQLKALLDEKGIAYEANATKVVLIALLDGEGND